MIIYQARASSIIYNFLKSNYIGGYYLLPVNICPIVPLVFRKANVCFEFIDIEYETLCINRAEVLKKIYDNECKGLLFAYTYGIDLTVDEFFKKIRSIRPEFIIIEDKCLNIPSFKLSDASAYATLTIYSTGYGKFADLGYGGFAVSHSELKYKHFNLKYNQKSLNVLETKYKEALKTDRYLNNIKGDWLNNNCFIWQEDEYHNMVKDKIIESYKIKEEINNIYNKFLPQEIMLKRNKAPLSKWRYCIIIKKKEELLNRIFNESLFASSHYKPLDGILTKKKINCVMADQLFSGVVNLFNDRYFDAEKASKIAQIILSHYRKSLKLK